MFAIHPLVSWIVAPGSLALILYRVSRMRMMALLVALAIMSVPACADEVSPHEHEVRAAVDRFLHAFENLDMQSFIRCFADIASVFFPMPVARRIVVALMLAGTAPMKQLAGSEGR